MVLVVLAPDQNQILVHRPQFTHPEVKLELVKVKITGHPDFSYSKTSSPQFITYGLKN